MSTAMMLSLSLVVGAPALKDPPARPQAIEGEWFLVERTVGGKQEVLAAGPKQSRFSISTDQWVINQGNDPPSKWELQLDAAARPAQITLYKPDGVRSETGLVGIYKVEGDTLTICYVFKGTRPTSFESPDGTEIRIMVLKRAREK